MTALPPELLQTLVGRVRKGDQRAIGRAISIVEAGDIAVDLMAALFPETGRGFCIGVTGPPGAGKSTLVDRMVAEWRRRGRRVAVLAVDPSSPFTGGSVLGDRFRMSAVAQDPSVFIRSMASRGHLGGIASATVDAVRVLDAAGYEVIIVETVGVGQSEVSIAESADCTVVVSVPGMGDRIQAMKAGVLEIGDVFVVNKADRDGARETLRELMAMLQISGKDPVPKVLLTRANDGEGIGPLIDEIDRWLEEMKSSGKLQAQRLVFLKKEVRTLIAAVARRKVLDELTLDESEELVEALRTRRTDPASVARRAVARTLSQVSTPGTASSGSGLPSL